MAGALKYNLTTQAVEGLADRGFGKEDPDQPGLWILTRVRKDKVEVLKTQQPDFRRWFFVDDAAGPREMTRQEFDTIYADEIARRQQVQADKAERQALRDLISDLGNGSGTVDERLNRIESFVTRIAKDHLGTPRNSGN